MTGVGVHTLRAWERRYSVPVPQRSDGRQRVYSAMDIELINRMKQLSSQGIPLARAAEIGRRELEERGSGDGLVDSLVGRLFRALMLWDEATASKYWSEALDKFDIQSTFERVAAPLLRELGMAWHNGAITVAQEHFASNFVRARLDLLSRQVNPLPDSPVVMLACVEGEHHEMGLLMLAVLLRFNGLRTIYLGQNVPDDDLVRTVADSQPHVLALNAGTLDGASRMPVLLRRLHSVAPTTQIVFGGGAFDSDASVRTLSGAHYGGPDLQSALLLINQLGRKARAGGSS